MSQPAPPFNAVLDMKQLMNWVIDPSAQAIWASVGTVITEEGTKELAPASDGEWTQLRNSAAILIESSNLMMLEGRARDRGDWMMKARRLSDAAQEARRAIEARDTQALFVAGGTLYQACSDCHAQYMSGMPARVAPQ